MLPLSADLIRRINTEVYDLGRGKLRACPYFNKGRPVTFSQLEEYFAGHHSISLHESPHLPSTVLGLTLKRQCFDRKTIDRKPLDEGWADVAKWTPPRKNRVFIVINARLARGWIRHFTTGHELGHAILHGSLLLGDGRPATHVAQAKATSFYHGYSELEANLFSLVLLIPDSFLIKLGSCPSVEYASNRLIELYKAETGMDLPCGAASDRIKSFMLYHHSVPANDWRFIIEGTGYESGSSSMVEADWVDGG